jgi:hypothetical protein
MVKAMQARQHQAAQLWLAAAGLFAAGGMLRGGAVDAWALVFGIGFAATVAGLATLPALPSGPAIADFNDWAALRRPGTAAQERLLSTWQHILDRATDNLSMRALRLNLSLAGLAIATCAALAGKIAP